MEWAKLNEIEREIEYGPRKRYWQVRAELKRDSTPQGKVWECDYLAWPWDYRPEGLVEYHGGTAWLGAISDISAEDARRKFQALMKQRQASAKRYPEYGAEPTCSIGSW